MSELTDRLRTCVAHLTTIEISEILTDDQMEAIIDARKLLVEAADELEKPIEVRLGEPMKIIETITAPAQPPLLQIPPGLPQPGSGFWYDNNPAITHQPSRKACPKCDSRANKTVHASKKGFRLECPVCGHAWKR